MTITFAGIGDCPGCGARLNLWHDGLHVVPRERSQSWAPVHLCDDPEKREHIELPFDQLVAFECWRCGSRDVAPSSWGRMVEFPGDPELMSWAEGWVGPLQEHVCVPPVKAHETPAQRRARGPAPVWEAFQK